MWSLEFKVESLGGPELSTRFGGIPCSVFASGQHRDNEQLYSRPQYLSEARGLPTQAISRPNSEDKIVVVATIAATVIS